MRKELKGIEDSLIEMNNFITKQREEKLGKVIMEIVEIQARGVNISGGGYNDYRRFC